MDIRAHVEKLNEKRLRAWDAQKAELDNTAGRERTAEEQARIERMDAEIDELDAEIREYVMRERRESEAAQLREAQARVFSSDPGVATPQQAVNELRSFLDACMRGEKVSFEVDIRSAAKERELLRQGATAYELRDLAWDTGSSGSLVPTTLARTLYEYMEASNGIFRAPTTKLNTTSGEPLDLPRVSAHTIGTLVVAQGTAIGGTDPTFARTRLDAFKYGALVVVASEVVTDAGIDIEGFLGRNIGRALGRVIATDLVAGSGSGRPNGIMTAIVGAGTIATGGSLITPTVEKLIDLQYSVNDEYRNSPDAAWLMNDSTAGTLRKLRDGAGGTIGAFLWQPSLTQGIINGQPDRLLDKPVFTDPNVAAAGSNNKTVAFGDMSAYYVRTVGNPVIERDDSRYFDTDEIGFRGKWRVDGDLLDTTAVNVMKQSV
jgi:HK97 family phage major capsid protein